MSIVTIGEVVVDWLSIKPGETMSTAAEFYRALGGNATNTAIGLSRLGNDVKLIGKVGDDLHGRYLMEKLRVEGLDLSYLLVDSRYPTAQCYMTTAADGDHQFFNWPKPHAADMLFPEEVVPEAFERVRFLHATGISLLRGPRKEAVEKSIALASERGAIVSFDASFPTGAAEQARANLEEVFSRVHILKFNQPELMFWADARQGESLEILARRVFARYEPVAVVVTLSSAGSFILTASGCVHCPPLKVAASCEVGAGDAYAAGMIDYLRGVVDEAENLSCLGRLKQAQWQAAGIAGNVAGALVTRAISAYEAFPSRAEFDQFMGETSIQSTF